MGCFSGKCWADTELRTQETQPAAFHRSLRARSTSVTTILENLTTWTIARFAVMPLRINILKLRGFSAKTQLRYLTNQLHVSAAVL